MAPQPLRPVYNHGSPSQPFQNANRVQNCTNTAPAVARRPEQSSANGNIISGPRQQLRTNTIQMNRHEDDDADEDPQLNLLFANVIELQNTNVSAINDPHAQGSAERVQARLPVDGRRRWNDQSRPARHQQRRREPDPAAPVSTPNRSQRRSYQTDQAHAQERDHRT